MRSFGGAALTLALAQQAAGHAYMTQPASRMAHAHSADPRTEFHTEFEPQSAGGDGGFAPCGKIRGHDYTDHAWNAGQAGAHQMVKKGEVLQVEVTVTAHHWGHFEFSMCDLDTLGPFTGTASEQKEAKDRALWECFNDQRNLLVRHPGYEVYDPAPIDGAHPTRWYLPPRGVQSWPPQDWEGAPTLTGAGSQYRMWLKVPQDANCDGDNCLLFFFYYSSNSCEAAGYDEYMANRAPTQVKSWFDSREDKAWSCASCSSCAGVAEDGTVKDGKRAFDDMRSLGAPERFYGCADVSTQQGTTISLPPVSDSKWCAERVCDESATPVPTTRNPTSLPTTKQPTTSEPSLPEGETAAPSTKRPTVAPSTASPVPPPAQGDCSSWCNNDTPHRPPTQCGVCSAEWCHGRHVEQCGDGLVFNAATVACDWPWNVPACPATPAAARRVDAGTARVGGSKTLVLALGGAVALLSACLVAAVVVLRRERAAAVSADEPDYRVVKDANCDV